MLKRFFSPPVFADDPEKTRDARLLHQIILAALVIPLLALTVYIIKPTLFLVLPLNIVFLITLITLLFLNHSGRVKLASRIIVGVLIAIPTLFNFLNAGEVRPFLLITVIAILMSGLLLGSRAAIFSALFFIAQYAIIAPLNLSGMIVAQSQTTFTQSVIVIVVSYLLIGLIYRLAILKSQTALSEAQKSESDLQLTNRKLLDLSASLEQRVATRTEELEATNALNEKLARQFEAITRISRTIASVQKLPELLPLISTVISEQFGFYHTGIFLLDDNNQYALLRAANSEGGKRMLKRGHQLKIGEQGIVGYVTGTGNARIALDVDQDTTFFNNPDLPETHSEMALPLRISGTIIGALDIQSTESNAFSTEDIRVLTALADQVSVAIQNARLFGQSETSLAEADALQRQYVRETWSHLPHEEDLKGFRYSMAGVTPLRDDLASETEKDNTDKQEISVPIMLRGETIGTLLVQIPVNERTNEDQLDLIKAVADRVALAAENARLFEDTTRRAERERIISDITSKIGTSVRTESILKTTARELNQFLNGADIFIKLGTNENGNGNQETP